MRITTSEMQLAIQGLNKLMENITAYEELERVRELKSKLWESLYCKEKSFVTPKNRDRAPQPRKNRPRGRQLI
ncbi:hypothetical protein GXP67_21145 [Rhodocytophaga rosea]|uniref:Uncharacterized protein n=1 Tax=Rhodocytophaga rosea TaxID=2704465 RepID=A0A6C0GM10_9BACT|nr:hypothetical protein [Rhodocytophaga rosea]QHT68977.1 hypothetical protein GXP67_21145 [Rhodocytophaga rosea]